MKVKPALFAVCALVAIAALPLPYAYYVGIRFVACGAFLFVAWEAWQVRAWVTLGVAAVAAATFNPVVPLHASKSVWAAIDLTAATYLAVVAPRIQSRFRDFWPPSVSPSDVVRVIVVAAFGAIFFMVLLAFLLFLVSLPADLLRYKAPSRVLAYLFPAVGVAAAAGLLTGWGYWSGHEPLQGK